jgi:hypothetical protein
MRAQREREEKLYTGKNAKGTRRLQGYLTVILSNSLQDLRLVKKKKIQ